jgi:hypothetical protein
VNVFAILDRFSGGSMALQEGMKGRRNMLNGEEDGERCKKRRRMTYMYYAGEKCMLVQYPDGRRHSFLRFADGITCQFNALTLGTMPGRSAYDLASNAATTTG